MAIPAIIKTSSPEFFFSRLKRIQSPENFKIVDDIFEIVAETTGVPKNYMSTKSREATRVQARHLFHYLTYKHTDLTLSQIGSYTKRDHCSVIHSCKKMNQWIATETSMRTKVDAMEHYIVNKGAVLIRIPSY